MSAQLALVFDPVPACLDAAGMRAAVLRVLEEVGEATPDEIAGRLGLSVLSVRPRCTELLRNYKSVERTGERRANASGLRAHVLRRTAGVRAAPAA